MEMSNIVLEWIASYKELRLENKLLEKSFEELNINSIEFIGLVVKCESEFGITFEDEKLSMDEYSNIGAFVTYLLKLYNCNDER